VNIFLLHTDYTESGRIFKAKDPIRFNKQIVECAQLLAFFEIWHTGKSTLLKSDGTPYRAIKAQLNHPMTLHMKYHKSMYNLCWDTLQGLLVHAPLHQCRFSIAGYKKLDALAPSSNQEYIIVRRGYPILRVKSLEEYVTIITKYLEDHKWD
jgi:hypothetical protein